MLIQGGRQAGAVPETGSGGRNEMKLSKKEQSRLLNSLMEMGDLMLDAGAEISRVEETLARMGAAYGAERTDVFVITSVICMTMEFPDCEPVTEMRRIHSDGQQDYYRLDKLNGISRSCCAAPLPPAELEGQLASVAAGRKPLWRRLTGSVLAAAAFAVFFGGTLLDGLVAGLFGLGISYLKDRLSETQINTIAMDLIVSLLVGLGVGGLSFLIPALHMDMILIGDIMLLIPGLALTNAIRNILVGDTISGVVRLTETLLWAAALAGGIMVALSVLNFWL